MAWHTVAKTTNVTNNYGMVIDVPGVKKPVALFKHQDQFFAVVDECSHAYSPLSGGEVVDYIVTCPYHGAQFDVRDGKGIGDLAYPDIRSFPVRVVDDDVQVEVE